MVRKLVEVGSPIVALGVGLMTERILAHLPIVGLILLIIGGIILLIALVIHLGKKMWPNRDNWYALSSYPHEFPPEDPQRAINKNRSEQWRSCDPQEVDEWFEVDMEKERTLSRIEFIPDDSEIEKPKKWRMMFYGEDGNKLKQTLGHKDGQYNIIVQGKDIPNRIRWFRVEIKEVAEDMEANSNYAKRKGTTKVYWAISLIKVWEYRFSIFGRRFCEHEL